MAPAFPFYALQSFIPNIPLLVFFSISLECFSGLTNEVTEVKIILEERQTNYSLLSRILKVITMFEKVGSHLSFNIWWFMGYLSIEILIFLYLVPANFINYSRSSEPISLLLSAAMFSNAIYFCSLMWFINIRAQRVTDMLHQLKSNLQDIYVSEIMVTYEYQKVPASFMKDRILDKMNNFDGFDGKGYFVLGKSFLLSFFSFCLTYFVILLQFKLSE